MFRLTGLFVFAFLAFNALAQEITVVNETTSEPIESVAIYNQDKSKSTLTDENGKARLNLFDDSDTLYFQHPSYSRNILPYNVLKNFDKISLERKIILIPEFVITASKHREDIHDIASKVDV